MIIPQYDQTVGVMGRAPDVRADINPRDEMARGPALGLAKLGEGLSGYGAGQQAIENQKLDALEKSNRQQAMLDATVTASALQNTATQFVADSIKNVTPETVSGLAGRVNDSMSTLIDKQAGDITDPVAKQHFLTSGLAMRNHFFGVAIAAEAQASSKFAEQKFGQAIDNYRRSVYTDPTQFEMSRNAFARLLQDDSVLGYSDKTKLQQTADAELAHAAGMTDVARNPKAFLDAVGRPLPDQPPVAYSNGAASGLLKPGNLSALGRAELKNEDGSVSTALTFSIATDAGEVLIPQVVDGKLLSRGDAIERFHKTGENFGTFSNAKAADAYANRLHEQMAGDAADVPALALADMQKQGQPLKWQGRPIVLQNGRAYYEPPPDATASVDARKAGPLTDAGNGTQTAALEPIKPVAQFPWMRYLPPEKLETFVNEATRLAKQGAAVDVAGFKHYADGQINIALTGTGQVPNQLTREQFDGIYGSDRGAAEFASYKYAMAVGAQRATLTYATNAEIQRKVQGFAPSENPATITADNRSFGALIQAAKSVLDQRAQDPAAYALKSRPQLADQFKEAFGPQGNSQKVQDYVRNSIAEQDRLMGSHMILADDQSNAIIQDLQRPAQSGDDAVVRINKLRDQYGQFFPDVYRELLTNNKKRDVPDALVFVPALNGNAAVQELAARLDPMKLDDIKKMVDPTNLKGIESSIASAWQPMVQAYFPNAENAQSFGAMRRVSEKMATYYVSQGLSSDDAAKKAIAPFLAPYDFPSAGSDRAYLVPKREQADLVSAGVKQANAGLFRNQDIFVPPSSLSDKKPQDARYEYLSQLQSSPVWATNNDLSGLWLFRSTPNGYEPVKKADGSNYGFTWNQFRDLAMGPKTPDERPTGVGGVAGQMGADIRAIAGRK